MTRINCVPPSELSGPHLVAEYRELPRVFGQVRARVHKGQTPADVTIPAEYRLGPGHVTFFFDKLQWLHDRQVGLIAEMQNRGYKPQHLNPSSLLEGIPSAWCGDWRPTEKAKEINRSRIRERTRS